MNTHQSPSKLALLSRHKLQQESAAEEPDLRRCLGHNAVLFKSMSAARRDIIRYPKSSSRFYEDNEVNKKEDQGSVIRAQIAKAVRGMIKRRSLASPEVTDVTATAITTTTTTTLNDNVLARIPSNSNSTNTTSTLSNLISSKRRQCVARLVSGRKFWAPSMMVQTSAG